MKSRKQIIIRVSGHAKVCFGRDEDEHDECVRLKEEVCFLKSRIAEFEMVNKQQKALLDKFLLSN